MTKCSFFFLCLLLLFSACNRGSKKAEAPFNLSGVFPHLAYYNNEGECGTGAVVPWAGRLWVITYGQHFPEGSSDKLYEITDGFQQIVREESTGGTPANRMIHDESGQLFIGPYAIDAEKNVRVIPYSEMPGRHTGNARHLTDPENKIYYATMEEGFYEVEVESLEVTTLYKDARTFVNEGTPEKAGALLPGAHGKGLFSGQGVLVYSNNGESGPDALEQFDIPSGVLAEWDGKDWTVVRRNQFVEVTGPGGIHGNADPANDPIWATGWDHRSLLLGVRDRGEWSFYRLPKASHSYDGAHGWNTEWPRIRDVGVPGKPDYLMTMHGMFWRFPGSFSAGNSAGVRPRSAYLKVIGDFARWNGRLVMGCDDSAQKEFLNKRSVKGDIGGPGQSNSNLWFIDPGTPDRLGPSTATGAVWLEEQVEAGVPSEPFLFTGWAYRSAWLANHGDTEVSLLLETDQKGDGDWTTLRTVELRPGVAERIVFADGEDGEWIRLTADGHAGLTAIFTYCDTDERPADPDPIFNGLCTVKEEKALQGLLYGPGDDRRVLGMAASVAGKDAGYYELDESMQLTRKEDPGTEAFIEEQFAIPRHVVTVDEASVLVVDDRGRRWRFPLGDDAYSRLTDDGELRICREVATERDLFSLHGTFYELPAENADGFAKVRPVASHAFRIHDYASYRGMLIMTGIDPGAGQDNPHIILSDNGKAAVWAGVIDDLWKLGKPTGSGGPWKGAGVRAGVPSDPYLIGYYDERGLSLLHDRDEPVNITIEVDPMGQGQWMEYIQAKVQPGEEWDYAFPEGFHARWIRFTADSDCTATAWLMYK